jgi:hypothetical protein
VSEHDVWWCGGPMNHTNMMWDLAHTHALIVETSSRRESICTNTPHT